MEFVICVEKNHERNISSLILSRLPIQDAVKRITSNFRGFSKHGQEKASGKDLVLNRLMKDQILQVVWSHLILQSYLSLTETNISGRSKRHSVDVKFVKKCFRHLS